MAMNSASRKGGMMDYNAHQGPGLASDTGHPSMQEEATWVNIGQSSGGRNMGSNQTSAALTS